MELSVMSRVFVLVIWLELITGYEIPEVKIEVFSPKGFKASIPDAPNISLFVFQGNINRAISSNDIGTLTGEIVEATNGRWEFIDPDVKLKSGDVINYYVFVSENSAGYLKDDLSYKVSGIAESPIPNQSTLSPQSTPPPSRPTRPPSGQCKPTVTQVRGSTACAGQTIFEDNFDNLREDLWQIQHFIPIESPEYPFVSYQRLATNPTVSVSGGNLHIKPTLQQTQPGFTNDSIYSSNLDLSSGCTASACSLQAWGATILPPIVSGRMTSKAFAFLYGTVHVRAKLPQGDCLYPEILLEPFLQKYGRQNFASGVIKIAAARGNKVLRVGLTDHGNQVLYGGPIMDFKCRQYLLSSKHSGSMWGDDFHVYSIKWTPDRIILLVDSKEWARIEPLYNGLKGHFSSKCRDIPNNLLSGGTKMAPFDDYFYLTLGVAAGGISEFQDDLYTQSGLPKPWQNRGSKATLHFWQAMDAWYPTWNNAGMVVDYVKVVALETDE